MKISVEQLAGQLKRDLLPVYLITGDEPLIVSEALDQLRKAAHAQGYLSREIYFAERGFDWNNLSAAGQSMSLFSERKIIDLRLPTGKPGNAGSLAIAELLAHPPEDTLLLISAPKLEGSAMSSRWVKAIDKAGAVIRIWPMEPRDLPGWINNRMQKEGLDAERDAVLHLARRVEGNLLAAQQEIDKLALLHAGGRITADDIDAAVADSSRFTVFKLADEAMAGRTERAIRMLGRLRREGAAAVLVLWALGKEVRQLASMREQLDNGGSMASLMSSNRIWKNRQGITGAALQRLDCQILYQLVAWVERADRAAKGQSGEDAWELLLTITAGLASGRAPGLAA